MDVCTDQSVQTVFVWIVGYAYICKYNWCLNGCTDVCIYNCLFGWMDIRENVFMSLA